MLAISLPWAVLSGQRDFEQNEVMNIPNSLYRRRRFPPEVIAHAVLVYHLRVPKTHAARQGCSVP